jgi:hypothetical protein
VLNKKALANKMLWQLLVAPKSFQVAKKYIQNFSFLIALMGVNSLLK